MSVIPASFDPFLRTGGARFSLALGGLSLYLLTVHSFKVALAPAAIVIGLLGSLSQQAQLRIGAPIAWLAAWLAWSLMTGFASMYPSMVFEWSWEYAKLVVIVLVTVNACRTPNLVIAAAACWLACFVLFPMRGQFLNFLFGINEFGRYGWIQTFKHYNDLAAYGLLAVGICGFLLQLAEGRKLLRYALLFCMAALVLLVILTQSRGAFVGLGLSAAWFVARSRKRVQYAAAVVGLGLVVVLFAPASVWERFGNMKYLSSTETLGRADSSAEQRYLIQQIALAVLKDNAVVGVGLGVYPEVHALYAEQRAEWAFGGGKRDTHNMYLNVASETGIAGFVLFFGFLGSTLLAAIRAERSMSSTWRAGSEGVRVLRFGLIAFLITAIFGTLHRSSFVFVYAGLLFSAATVLPSMQPGRQSATAGGVLPSTRRRWSQVVARRSRGAARLGAPRNAST